MENFYVPFSVTTTTTTTTTIVSSSSSNVSPPQQNLSHPQNFNFPNESATPFGFQPPPCFIPHDPNHHLLPYGASYPLSIAQNTAIGMQNSQIHGLRFQSTEEDHRRMVEEMKNKTAREKRRQVMRQRSRSSAPKTTSSVQEAPIIRGQQVTSEDSNMEVTDPQSKHSYEFHTPDGKVIIN
jgi:hypothetical protein